VPYLFDPVINLLSFGFAAAIGVIFGYVPARRAAAWIPSRPCGTSAAEFAILRRRRGGRTCLCRGKRLLRVLFTRMPP
jgi:hypothetical protein